MAALTQPHTSSPARDLDQLLVDLICADEDLVRAEFEAIVAAEWPSTPPTDPAGAAPAKPAPRRDRRRRSRSAAVVGRPRHPGIGEWRRERSPPPGPNKSEDGNRAREGR